MIPLCLPGYGCYGYVWSRTTFSTNPPSHSITDYSSIETPNLSRWMQRPNILCITVYHFYYRHTRSQGRSMISWCLNICCQMSEGRSMIPWCLNILQASLGFGHSDRRKRKPSEKLRTFMVCLCVRAWTNDTLAIPQKSVLKRVSLLRWRFQRWSVVAGRG